MRVESAAVKLPGKEQMRMFACFCAHLLCVNIECVFVVDNKDFISYVILLICSSAA